MNTGNSTLSFGTGTLSSAGAADGSVVWSTDTIATNNSGNTPTVDVSGIITVDGVTPDTATVGIFGAAASSQIILTIIHSSAFSTVAGNNSATSFVPFWSSDYTDGFTFAVDNSLDLFPDNGDFPIVSLAQTSVPEPSTYAALLGIGVLGLFCLRRNKQKA